MGTILMGYDTEAAAVGEGLARLANPHYADALEPETTRRGLEIITAVHRDLAVPATLFVCGRTLLHSLEALQTANGVGLFDMQQHTYSYLPFRDIVYEAAPGSKAVIPATPLHALREEIAFTSDLLKRYLGSTCIGIRTPFGYYQGLKGQSAILAMLREQGMRYVSSWGRDEHNANPSPWIAPFSYSEDGHRDLLEIPFQFWLDAIWFDQYGWDHGARFREVLKQAVDEVAAHDYVYGVCFHEWVAVTAREDQTHYIRGFLEYAQERQVEVLSYSDYYRRLTATQTAERG